MTRTLIEDPISKGSPSIPFQIRSLLFLNDHDSSSFNSKQSTVGTRLVISFPYPLPPPVQFLGFIHNRSLRSLQLNKQWPAKESVLPERGGGRGGGMQEISTVRAGVAFYARRPI